MGIPFKDLLNSCDLGYVFKLVLELLPVQRSLASSIPLEICGGILTLYSLAFIESYFGGENWEEILEVSLDCLKDYKQPK
jgi:hypothetical protein